MESVQDGEPKAIATDINKLNAYMGNQRQQMVLSLSMKDLRELRVGTETYIVNNDKIYV